MTFWLGLLLLGGMSLAIDPLPAVRGLPASWALRLIGYLLVTASTRDLVAASVPASADRASTVRDRRCRRCGRRQRNSRSRAPNGSSSRWCSPTCCCLSSDLSFRSQISSARSSSRFLDWLGQPCPGRPGCVRGPDGVAAASISRVSATHPGLGRALADGPAGGIGWEPSVTAMGRRSMAFRGCVPTRKSSTPESGAAVSRLSGRPMPSPRARRRVRAHRRRLRPDFRQVRFGDRRDTIMWTRHGLSICVSAAVLGCSAASAQPRWRKPPPVPGWNAVTIRGEPQDLDHLPARGTPLDHKVIFMPGVGGWKGWAITVGRDNGLVGLRRLWPRHEDLSRQLYETRPTDGG